MLGEREDEGRRERSDRTVERGETESREENQIKSSALNAEEFINRIIVLLSPETQLDLGPATPLLQGGCGQTDSTI